MGRRVVGSREEQCRLEVGFSMLRMRGSSTVGGMVMTIANVAVG